MILKLALQTPFDQVWSSVLFLSIALVLAFFSTLAVQGKKAQTVSFLLRFLVWIGVWILLSRAGWVYAHKEVVRQKIAVFVDRSQSMQLPVNPNQSRWEEIQKFLKENKIWKEVEKNHEIQYFDFGDQVQRKTFQNILTQKPEYTSTLISSISEMAPEYDGVILLTDGVDTVEAGSIKDKIQQPMVAIYPDELKNLKDLAIIDSKVPSQVFLNAKIDLDFHVEAIGIDAPFHFRLWSGEKLIYETRLDVEDIKSRHLVVPVTWVPSEMGTQVLRAEVDKIQGEATFENNQKFTVVHVLRDRARILHVAGRPSWDERFLRDYFKENPNIDLVSFFILRQPLNNPEASENELSLIPFPYQDLFSTELPNFDLVVFQNFNFNRYFSSLYLENVRSYIENGGAFLIIGGNLSFGAGGYQGTPLEDTFPFLVRNDSQEWHEGAFRPEVLNSTHPVWESIRKLSVFQNLPLLQGNHRVSQIRPDSTVLLGREKEPVLSVRNYGKGRVAAIATDSLWTWTLNENAQSPKIYRQLINGIYRWLIRDESLSYIQADLKYSKIEFHVLNDQYKPFPNIVLEVTASLDGQQVQTELLAKTDSEGKTIFQIPKHGAVIEITARVKGKEREGYRLHTAFELDSSEKEFVRYSVDHEYLEKYSNGNATAISNVTSQTFKPIDSNAEYRWVGATEVRIWDHPLFLIIFLSLSCLEWFYRRQHSAN